MDYAAEAFYYAADNGARIASCSWGSSNTGGLGAAVDYFLATGGMIFKAAGNSNQEMSVSSDYMCGRSDIICVAATDQSDCKASFSNYGMVVDISAPGVGIDSLYHYHPDPASDYTATASGTSMATPPAVATAALIWAQHPDWISTQVRSKLLGSADAIDGLACNSSYSGKLGSGRINLYQAAYVDTDGDGVHDWSGGCPADPAKAKPGACGVPETDADGDGTPDCVDDCPYDPAKTEPGHCGCGAADTDTDLDGTLDCFDDCPMGPGKIAPRGLRV